MISFPEFFARVEKIPYQYTHPRLIYSIIRTLGIRRVIEIGCHIGYATCWMARGVQENGGGAVYCIDPFCWVNEAQESQFVANTSACDVHREVCLIKGRSEEVAWPISPELVFVDGNHTYPVAKHDADKAKLMGAKVIILHDTVAWEGSRKHSEETREQLNAEWAGWDFMDINSECGMTILIRREPKKPQWGEDIGEQWDKPQLR